MKTRMVPWLAAVALLPPATAAGTELDFTPEQKLAAAMTIRESGYNCPAVKLATAEGVDHYGTVFRVYCGPVGSGDDYYTNATYRITLTPNRQLIVRPWRD